MGGTAYIVQDVICNLIGVRVELDVRGPNYYTRNFRYPGTMNMCCALTFIVSIRFLHMVGRSQNLGAVSRD
jgi:hypothetical protein